MNEALLDIITGISGDMAVAALVDAGADPEYLEKELGKLAIKGYELKITARAINSIHAKKFEVVINEPQSHQSNLADILRMIDSSELSAFVKSNSKKIFETIGAAESRIHNVPTEQVHFHEVGAVDSIVDIVGTCICLESLRVHRVFTTPVKVGRGLIDTKHGRMPNPAPATLEILKDYPVEFSDIDFELTTPTGAAIVRALSEGVYSPGTVRNIKKTGFGAGSADIKESPNLLRAVICESPVEGTTERLIQVETNMDDINPQLIPYVAGKLYDAGARDVFYHDIVMKKGRPGILFSVLTDRLNLGKTLEVIYSETTTLGVRVNSVERHRLDREEKEANTSLGKVRVKIIKPGGDMAVRILPEFEECKRLAGELRRPLNEIYSQLMQELNREGRAGKK